MSKTALAVVCISRSIFGQTSPQAPARQPLSYTQRYRCLFTEVERLDSLVKGKEADGDLASAEKYRLGYFRDRWRLTDEESEFLKQVATDCVHKLDEVNRRAKDAVAAYRAKRSQNLPSAPIEMPSTSPDLKEFDEEDDNILNAHIEQLRSTFNEAAFKGMESRLRVIAKTPPLNPVPNREPDNNIQTVDQAISETPISSGQRPSTTQMYDFLFDKTKTVEDLVKRDLAKGDTFSAEGWRLGFYRDELHLNQEEVESLKRVVLSYSQQMDVVHKNSKASVDAYRAKYMPNGRLITELADAALKQAKEEGEQFNQEEKQILTVHIEQLRFAFSEGTFRRINSMLRTIAERPSDNPIPGLQVKGIQEGKH